jgi:hypothetical protein
MMVAHGTANDPKGAREIAKNTSAKTITDFDSKDAVPTVAKSTGMNH